MEKLRSIFNFIYGYYLDYRYKVPPASALSFAYYMILSIIPICTLLAFFTPFFPLDIKTAQEILSYYLRPDVTKNGYSTDKTTFFINNNYNNFNSVYLCCK